MVRLVEAMLLFLISGPFAGAVAAAEYRLLRIDGFNLKWDAPLLGTGATVSYGFATQATQFPDAINCRSLAPMALLQAAWGGDPARLAGLAEEAFGMWSGAAGISFHPAGPDERPDILIGAQAAPRRVAFANVWHDASAARDGVAPLVRATICFNPEIGWTTGNGPWAAPGQQDLRTALAHEIGHAIGLDHPGATGSLMGFQDQGPLDGLLPGDATGAVSLYGAPRPHAAILK